MRRAAHHFFSGRGKTLPLSTLLLAALCVLLAAPSSHASSREYSRDAILSVLSRGELSASVLGEVLAPRAAVSQLSVLEIRKLRELLSQLDQSQLVELQKQLSAYSAFSIDEPPLPDLTDFAGPPTEYSAPTSQLRAQEVIALLVSRLE